MLYASETRQTEATKGHKRATFRVIPVENESYTLRRLN